MKGTMFIRLLIIAVFFFTGTDAFAQSGAAERRGAVEGDSIWVVINYVKPDKRQQFERFVYEIFWPASEKLDNDARRAFTHTRVLNPAEPEEDGTYPYIFLMDPIISGEDYWIDSILKKMYPEDKAEEYFNMFQETLAKDGQSFRMLQSKYWGSAAK